MNKFICKKVKKIKLYHRVLAYIAKVILKTEVFYCTEELLKKEISRRKHLIENIRKLLKNSSEDKIKEQFKKAFDEIKIWQEEIDIMEKELQR